MASHAILRPDGSAPAPRVLAWVARSLPEAGAMVTRSYPPSGIPAGNLVSERDRRAVLQANATFYEAFESGRIENMERVWTGTEQDRCIHPGWPILSGWPSVRQSWLGIFNGSSDIHIELEEVDVLISGDLAFVTCIETFAAVAGGAPVSACVAATNLFQRRGDDWRMIHHHGSPLVRERERMPKPPARTVH
jgi:ketosteroid isomerase-like protein